MYVYIHMKAIFPSLNNKKKKKKKKLFECQCGPCGPFKYIWN